MGAGAPCMRKREAYSGGRALLGRFDGSAIHLKEAHRFENRAVPAGGGLYWDFYGLYSEVRNGIGLASIQGDLVSIGLDTWGVDFGLLDANDELLSTPHSHRDTRTQGTMEAVLDIVPRDRVFDQTGVQFLEINTLFQLYSMVRDGSPQLDIASATIQGKDVGLPSCSTICRSLRRSSLRSSPPAAAWVPSPPPLQMGPARVGSRSLPPPVTTPAQPSPPSLSLHPTTRSTSRVERGR